MPAVIHHPGYGTYSFGEEHPFSPVRVAMTLDLLEALGHPAAPLAPPIATREEVLTAHDEDYVRRVEALGAGEEVPDARSFGLGTPDTPAFSGMDEAARWHVGGTLHGARLIARGEARRVLQLGGGMHHARRRFAAGFCVYNDLVVAIHALTREDLRVAYLDLDVHHGDGVQDLLYADERVLTISLHESGRFLFPGSGDPRELGEGMAKGFKLNLPLEPLTEGASYLEVFDDVVPPALRAFSPDVLVVQAGADAHFDDPLADLMLTTRDYEALFRKVLRLADRLARGRVLFALGGGYSLRAAPRVWTILSLLLKGLPVPDAPLPAPWLERWARALGPEPPRALHDPVPSGGETPGQEAVAHRNRQVAQRLLGMANRYWP